MGFEGKRLFLHLNNGTSTQHRSPRTNYALLNMLYDIQKQLERQKRNPAEFMIEFGWAHGQFLGYAQTPLPSTIGMSRGERFLFGDLDEIATSKNNGVYTWIDPGRPLYRFTGRYGEHIAGSTFQGYLKEVAQEAVHRWYQDYKGGKHVY